ncbi:flagellar biosynthetic protein FliR [Thermodesulfovibrionales bacterium]|nr:flagellar biosynthetic protein FliR [Thermodesulfovibrionales bacterium]MCL0034013.1 flagellar biosynthetic protein FliR [Thermodesulfovibrionales bacterium]MCL0047045.1 flagellar biosynthetic protein FliR [Thermodesulfovibrionales bacterium]MCL0062184.1 flagellar biosynthetic protein FliR [Thermodesulfovibrionales bacterium]MCL0072485.1 flagellar biosynthetic protein FliR [Thermodesulfovibrionales bacterium]
MELYTMINIYAERFIIIFIRVAVILSFIPFIGGRLTPMKVRASLAIAITLLLLPVVPSENIKVDNPVEAVFEALFIGAAIGLTVRLILSAVEMAAQWISFQMGLGMAVVFNPAFGEILGPLSLFYSLLAMMVFFILGIHHFFILGIVRSFDISDIQYAGIFSSIMELNSIFFPLAFKIAAPVLVVQLMIYFSVGFLARALPQANIFFISFPLLIAVGILFVALSLPMVLMVISKAFMHVMDAIMVFVE